MPKKPTLQELQQHIAELTEALQRERADAVNIRRRHEEQIASLKTMVKTSVVDDLLPVIDNFERALKHVPKELEANDYIKGVQGVVKQFEDTLVAMGVEKIKTVGEHFDPKLHEAVAMDVSSEALAKGGDGNSDSLDSEEVICEELQPGYILGDQVIRHAMVKVKKEKR